MFNIHRVNDLTKLKKIILHQNSIVSYYIILQLLLKSEINHLLRNYVINICLDAYVEKSVQNICLTSDLDFQN